MPTKHKMVLCLRRLIFDSPLTRFLFFLLQHHHLQYVIRERKENREKDHLIMDDVYHVIQSLREKKRKIQTTRKKSE